MNRSGWLTGSGIVGALLVPFAVAAAAFASGGGIFSSGPLNAIRGPAPVGGVWSHAELACSDCHTPFWSAERMGDRCLACHTDVAVEMSVPNALHAGLATPANCRRCHPEHRGGQGALILYQPDLYPHAEFGFFLIAHLRNDDGRAFACDDCHGDTSRPFQAATCIECHSRLDPGAMAVHELDFGFDCLACHDGIDSYGSRFDHQATDYPLEGLHLDLGCSTCHAGAGNLHDLRVTPTDCVACHSADDPHQGSLGADCAACHSASGWSTDAIDHGLTGFPLVGGHIGVTCETCHVGGQLSGVPTSCVDCHRADDPHGGRLGDDCGRCHTADAWSILIDGSFDHRLTGFKLTGAHVRAECTSCHRGGQFAGTPTSCVACHKGDDAHRGSFGTDCSACHTTNAWKPATFDHGRTGFNLSGGHAGVACSACHANGRYQGTPTSCVACHASNDKHNGAFGTDCAACHSSSGWGGARFDHSQTGFQLTGRHSSAVCSACHVNGRYQGTPKACIACHASDDKHNGANGTSCADCHTTSGWGGAKFDHSKTAFPLTGRHTGAACSACHANGQYQGTPKACIACHASNDKHNGTFGTNCAGCHTTSGWGGASFNHNSTAFPLTGRHTSVACSACHANGQYQGTPKTCIACHASNDKHNGANGTNCAGCHTTSGWGGASFNHNTTAFPLTGRHTSAACSACHGNGQYRGTPKACVACHSEPSFHSGAFGTQCSDCHTTSGWRPAQFGGSHTFPIRHHGAESSCANCHPSTVNDYTCARCHDPRKMAESHASHGISSVDNCVGCHPNGKKP